MERLIVTDNYNGSSWVIDCPFEKTTTQENKEWFRDEIMKIYREFCDRKITLDYEDELDDIEKIKF